MPIVSIERENRIEDEVDLSEGGLEEARATEEAKRERERATKKKNSIRRAFRRRSL